MLLQVFFAEPLRRLRPADRDEGELRAADRTGVIAGVRGVRRARRTSVHERVHGRVVEGYPVAIGGIFVYIGHVLLVFSKSGVRRSGLPSGFRGRDARRGLSRLMLLLPASRASGLNVEHLRHPSPRPSVVVDPAAFGVVDQTGGFVGRAGPLGRERVLFALPLDPGPALLSPPTVVHDPGAAYLADPEGGLIGEAAVWVERMLTARWTEDTRRF